MADIIHCTLRVGDRQSFVSFDLRHDRSGKPFVEIGNDAFGNPIKKLLDPEHIIPDQIGRPSNFEYRQEIFVVPGIEETFN